MGERLTAKQRAFAKAIDAARLLALREGDAQWTNGYRAGRPSEEAKLHAKEMRQWTSAGEADAAFVKALKAYGRACERAMTVGAVGQRRK
jgi:hypothetical protein